MAPSKMTDYDDKISSALSLLNCQKLYGLAYFVILFRDELSWNYFFVLRMTFSTSKRDNIFIYANACSSHCSKVEMFLNVHCQ